MMQGLSRSTPPNLHANHLERREDIKISLSQEARWRQTSPGFPLWRRQSWPFLFKHTCADVAQVESRVGDWETSSTSFPGGGVP